MNRLNKRGRAGFTLAETLLAVLILLLVSGIVATGVPVARNVYEKVVLGANAQVMLSTAADALRNELGTAWKVRVVDDYTVTYFSSGTGWQSQMLLNKSIKDKLTDKEYTPIRITEYIKIEDGGLIFNTGSIKPDEHSLVPDSSSKLYVYCKAVGLAASHDGVIQFSKIEVRKKSDDLPLAVLENLEIRVISGDVEKISAI